MNKFVLLVSPGRIPFNHRCWLGGREKGCRSRPRHSDKYKTRAPCVRTCLIINSVAPRSSRKAPAYREIFRGIGRPWIRLFPEAGERRGKKFDVFRAPLSTVGFGSPRAGHVNVPYLVRESPTASTKLPRKLFHLSASSRRRSLVSISFPSGSKQRRFGTRARRAILHFDRGNKNLPRTSAGGLKVWKRRELIASTLL